MSRFYRMFVEIQKHNQNNKDAIINAANEEWNWDDFDSYNGNITACGEDNLCGGESEEEFSNRLTTAIWKANGDFCYVIVSCSYLEEDPPTEYYSFGEDEYNKWKNIKDQDDPCESCSNDCLGCEHDDQKGAANIIKNAVPVNNHVCPSCGNAAVSLSERDKNIPCWKCGGRL